LGWPGQDPAAFEAAVQRSETLLLEIMPQMQKRGQRLSDKRGINFAPKLVAETPEAKEMRVNETFLTEATKRLIASGRIQIRDDWRGHEILVVEVTQENSNP
jgi:hypothetical protein